MNWRNAGILIIVLVVPLALILVFKTGTTQLVNLPVYGEKSLVNGDSVDFAIDFQTILSNPEVVENKHVLLYLSEGLENSIWDDAHSNLTALAVRLEKAKVHPRNMVDDVVILSLSDIDLKSDTFSVWLKEKAELKMEDLIESKLQNSFSFCENPLKDHVSYLIDKDGRIRSIYYTAHGKFDRNILGELVVLRAEYGNEPIKN
ncbi:MAG: hypothetical protein JXQ87_04145 [Bacteroidia bacterium]